MTVGAKILLIRINEYREVGKGEINSHWDTVILFPLLSSPPSLTKAHGIQIPISALKKIKRKKMDILRVFASYFHL